MDSEIISALIASLLGGVVVAIVNYFLYRKKSDAEVEKTRAETEKIRAETSALLKEISDTVKESVKAVPETIIYDSNSGCDLYDFREYKAKDMKDGKWVGPRGEGSLSLLEDGVLQLERTNTNGRFYIFLRKYNNNGEEKEYLEEDVKISGKRTIRISCQAKVNGCAHTLYFGIRNKKSDTSYSRKYFRVTPDEEWVDIDFLCELSPEKSYQLRIADMNISKSPSKVFISNLRLAEKSRRI